jgi:hypothetical protein
VILRKIPERIITNQKRTQRRMRLETHTIKTILRHAKKRKKQNPILSQRPCPLSHYEPNGRGGAMSLHGGGLRRLL